MAAEAPKEVFLEDDTPIPGQKFSLLSFLSPERILEKKDLFFFEAFLKNYEFHVRTKSLEAFLMSAVRNINDKLDAEANRLDAQDLSGAADICRSSRIQVGSLMEELQQYVKKNQSELTKSALKEKYDDFMFANRAELEDKFLAKNEFTTTVRGLKIRGTYSTYEEAAARAKRLQRNDPIHNIYVAEVGKWIPWDPDVTEVKEQEYAEDQLNTLMKKYKENEEAREAEAANLKAEHERIRKARQAAPMGATSEDVASQMADMFGTSGPADLAIARKTAGADA
jgi:Family of unknown function (DUF5832)